MSDSLLIQTSGILLLNAPDIAGLSVMPDVFFGHGVTAMGGVLVTKPDDVLDIISEGGSGYHFIGRSTERMYIVRFSEREFGGDDQ